MNSKMVTVALVSESKPIQKVIKKCFAQVDCDIIAISSYDTAMDILRLNVVDLIFIDCTGLVLQQQDGVAWERGQQLVLKLKDEKNDTIPILLRVGNNELALLSDVKCYCVYIPFSSNEIINAAQKCLGAELKNYDW